MQHNLTLLEINETASRTDQYLMASRK